MSEKTNIIDELKNIHDGDAWHGPSLSEILELVKPEQAVARPLANAHSIWELVHHITAWENVFRRRLEGEQITEPERGDFPPVKEVSEEAWRQSLTELNTEHKRLLEVVAQLPDPALEKTVVVNEYSVRFLLHGIIRHQVYHAGQIALLRKNFL